MLVTDILNSIEKDKFIFCITLFVIGAVLLIAYIVNRILHSTRNKDLDFLKKVDNITKVFALLVLAAIVASFIVFCQIKENKIKTIPDVLEEEYSLKDVQFLNDFELSDENGLYYFAAKVDDKLRIYILEIKDGEATVYTDNGEMIRK